MAMHRALQRNGGRPRFNYEPVAAEECKDTEGEWTKWCTERCSDEEKEAYYKLAELCKEEPIVSWTTVNHRLRFLFGYKFDVEVSFNALVDAEKWRYENKCDTLT